MKRRIVLFLFIGIFVGLTVWIPTIGKVGIYSVFSYDEVLIEAGNHLQMVGIAALMAIGVGIPLGIVLTRRRARRLSPFVIGGAGLGQAVPSMALIALMAPLLGFNVWSAVIALFIYGLLPILRNTYAGIANVDPAILEAARGMGMSRSQITRRVELPLALPVIMAGIRTSTVINVGTATLAVLVGGNGLGRILLAGVLARQPILILEGAAPVAAMAVALDFLLESAQTLATPRGLRKPT